MPKDTLSSRLLKSLDRGGTDSFMVLEDRSVSYEEAARRIHLLAAWIEECNGNNPLVGVLAERGEHAYIGVFAALSAGRGWVPMTPRTPPARLRSIAQSAGILTVIVDRASLKVFEDVFKDWPVPVAGLVVDGIGSETGSFGGSHLIDATECIRDSARRATPSSETDIAYILFTSGTTGTPKGVPISHECVTSYLDFIVNRYGFGPGDRHTQTFELSFDLSVHDLLVPSTTGGAIVPFVGGELLGAARKVTEAEVTSWFSVPSQIAMMLRARALKQDSMPTLKTSLFCGEPLPSALVAEWAKAAPNSILENLYGPTEATIAVTYWRTNRDDPELGARRGITPIGAPFDNVDAILVDLQTNDIVHGEGRGELWLSGTQVCAGYWKLPEVTSEKFVTHPDQPNGGTWYRTGDYVERDASGQLHFVERIDQQIKLRGYRIELLEVEAALRNFADTPFLIVAAWPVSEGRVLGLTAVLFGSKCEPEEIIMKLGEILPAYMLPDRCVLLPGDPPRNASGKIDRNAVIAMLDEPVVGQ